VNVGIRFSRVRKLVIRDGLEMLRRGWLVVSIEAGHVGKLRVEVSLEYWQRRVRSVVMSRLDVTFAPLRPARFEVQAGLVRVDLVWNDTAEDRECRQNPRDPPTCP
jgi:hypothetical protein